jgi:ABC-type Fe3+/spermidine/putrescine transport system ATPase subunit
MLELLNISKKLGEFRLNDLSLSIDKGDYFCILGRSGAGKSMILELIAGLKAPDSGKILLNGEDITYARIHDRKIGLMFQEGLVFPHLSVQQNIAYALKSRKMKSAERNIRIRKWSEALGLEKLLQRSPLGLSGGELKRVALARVLAMEPEVVLLDEPLSSLDTMLQSEMRAILRSLNAEGQTFVHVTHDFYEAVQLASRVAVIQDGCIIQRGTSQEVLRNPVNEFVKHLTGVRDFCEK